MRPRLMDAAIVHEARLLGCEEVIAGDWRLLHVNEAACRDMVSNNPESHFFVTWPDLSLGFVVLPPADMAGVGQFRAALLMEAYQQSREYLEWLNLRLFDLSGAGTPQ